MNTPASHKGALLFNCEWGSAAAEPAAARRQATAALHSIGQQLGNTAVLYRGAATWRDLEQAGATNGQPQLIGPHVYDGISGVALFLAAYYSATGNGPARDLALSSLGPLIAKLAELDTRRQEGRPKSMAIGGLVGLGSFLYAFLKSAYWLRRSEFLQIACQVSRIITPDLIRADKQLDVVSGCAGTLLALLVLHAEPGVSAMERARALESAVLCGEHLVNHRKAGPSGSRGWSATDCPPLTGFAHGAAGIAYALLRLFEQTREMKYVEAALEGFDFERSLYDHERRAWLDLRFGRPLEQSAWCHGAPGIALARALAFSLIDDPIVHRDLESALSVTLSLAQMPSDHLCCGNCSVVEILHVTAGLLQRAELCQHAWNLVQETLRIARETGFRFPDSKPSQGMHARGEQPAGLFLGLAGVGYTLLRLLYPDRFSSVLCLQ